MTQVRKPGDQVGSRIKEQAGVSSRVAMSQVEPGHPDTFYSCSGVYTCEMEGQLTPAGHSGNRE